MAEASLGSILSSAATQSGKLIAVCRAGHTPPVSTPSPQHGTAGIHRFMSSSAAALPADVQVKQVQGGGAVQGGGRGVGAAVCVLVGEPSVCSLITTSNLVLEAACLPARHLTCFSNLALMESGGVVPKTSGGDRGVTAQGSPQCALAATASREVARLKRSTSTCTAWLVATATTAACSFKKVSSLSQHIQTHLNLAAVTASACIAMSQHLRHAGSPKSPAR